MTDPIHQEITFAASPERLFEALMSSKEHAEFTGGPADISREVGGEFSCHGGGLEGRNIELVPNERIVQAWRVSQWPAGVYSVVKIELVAEGKKTKLVLDHTGVPDEFVTHVADGWGQRYWEPLHKYFA